jgi:hypothetical protein
VGRCGGKVIEQPATGILATIAFSGSHTISILPEPEEDAASLNRQPSVDMGIDIPENVHSPKLGVTFSEAVIHVDPEPEPTDLPFKVAFLQEMLPTGVKILKVGSAE